MSLRRKLWLGFGGLLLIVIAVSVLSVVVLTRYSRTLERVFRENYDSALYCSAMTSSLDRLNGRAQQLAWGGSPPSSDADVAAERRRFDDNLGRQLGNVTLPGELQLTQHVQSLWGDYQRVYADFDAGPAGQRGERYRRELLPRYQALKHDAEQISDMNMSNMVSVDGRVKRTLVDVRNALLVLVIAATILATAVVGTVAAAALKPLRLLTESARRIGAGDLERRVDVGTRDEVGQLADAFNAMAAQLRDLRRLDADRLLRTQQTTQLAIDSLPDAVLVIGPTGQVEISNRMAASHFGIVPGKAVGGLGLPWLSEIYAEVAQREKPHDPPGYKTAIRLFHDGEERWLLPRAVPMLDSDRRAAVIGVTVTLVDVTRLRQEDELKSGMVSTVSHELRTPLTSIRMAVLLMLGGKFGALGDKQRQLMATARDDSDRLYGLIENLLNLGRIESGRAQFQLGPVDPTAAIRLALDPLREEFMRRDVRVHEDPATAAAPEVLADPVFLGLVLANLLSNALKFTPAGGEIWARAARHDERGTVRFSVEDTGPGVPDEYRQRLFDKFFRIPQANGPTGAGLGLAIAKEIVEAQGGQIGCSSRAGGAGSTFWFTLPIARVRTPVLSGSLQARA